MVNQQRNASQDISNSRGYDKQIIVKSLPE